MPNPTVETAPFVAEGAEAAASTYAEAESVEESIAVELKRLIPSDIEGDAMQRAIDWFNDEMPVRMQNDKSRFFLANLIFFTFFPRCRAPAAPRSYGTAAFGERSRSGLRGQSTATATAIRVRAPPARSQSNFQYD